MFLAGREILTGKFALKGKIAAHAAGSKSELCPPWQDNEGWKARPLHL